MPIKGGYDEPMRLTVYDWDKNGGHDVSFFSSICSNFLIFMEIIGEVDLTLRDLVRGEWIYPLVKPDSEKGKR